MKIKNGDYIDSREFSYGEIKKLDMYAEKLGFELKDAGFPCLSITPRYRMPITERNITAEFRKWLDGKSEEKRAGTNPMPTAKRPKAPNPPPEITIERIGRVLRLKPEKNISYSSSEIELMELAGMSEYKEEQPKPQKPRQTLSDAAKEVSKAWWDCLGYPDTSGDRQRIEKAIRKLEAANLLTKTKPEKYHG